MDFGGFKKSSSLAVNRLGLSNSHRKVLANLNAVITDILSINKQASNPANLSNELDLIAYNKRLAETAIQIKHYLQSASNQELHKGGLFNSTRELVKHVNEMFHGRTPAGLKERDVPYLFLILERLYLSNPIALTRYNKIVKLLESNYPLIEQGNTEKSSANVLIKGVIEKPIKYLTGNLGMAIAAMTPLSLLAAHANTSAAEHVKDAWDANEKKVSGGLGSFDKSYGSGNIDSGFGNESTTSSRRISGNVGSANIASSITLGLYNFFNKEAFQAKWTLDLYNKLILGTTPAAGGILSNLGWLGQFLLNFGKILSGLWTVLSGYGKVGLLKGGLYGGLIAGGAALGAKVFPQLAGILGLLGKYATPIGWALTAVQALWGAFQGFKQVEKIFGKNANLGQKIAATFGGILESFSLGALKTEKTAKWIYDKFQSIAGFIDKAFGWITKVINNVTGSLFDNSVKTAAFNPLGAGTFTGTGTYMGTGIIIPPEAARYINEANNRSKIESSTKALATLPNTEAARVEANTKAFETAANKIIESNEEIAKKTSISIAMGNKKSLPKGTNNPAIEFTNSGNRI